MSFKRVADDFDDFNLQRKRRVNDLLLEDISSDEVHLMANGKLACTVCRHRPVFDTTAMLTIHRNGKKHISNAFVKLERAKEDAEIKQKRQHEHYLKHPNASSIQAPLLGITNMHKEKALHFASSTSQSSIADEMKSDNNLSNCSTRGNFDNLCGNSAQGGSTKANFFSPKSSFSQSNSQNSRASLPVSVNQRTRGHAKEISKTNMNSNFQDQKLLSASAIHNTASPSETSTIVQITKGEKTLASSSNQNLSISGGKNKEYNYLKVKKETMKDRFLSVNPLTQQKTHSEPKTTSNNEDNTSSQVVAPQIQRELSEYEKLDQKSRAVYVSKLRQLGWVMGLDGKWQKDADAEFDSDEDEPPSPNTALRG